jgi:hypothetical protein
LWHLAGHTYKETSELGDSLGFSFQESKAFNKDLFKNTQKPQEQWQQQQFGISV